MHKGVLRGMEVMAVLHPNPPQMAQSPRRTAGDKALAAGPGAGCREGCGVLGTPGLWMVLQGTGADGL